MAATALRRSVLRLAESLVRRPRILAPAVRSLQLRGFATESTPTAQGESQIYHAGLRYTEFTNKCEISSESQTIPIFRVMGYDGKLQNDWSPPMSDEEVLEHYKFMVRFSVYDLMMYTIQRQGRISFYMQNQGEEALQRAVGVALRDGDILWGQYRELGVLMSRGFTVQDALNQLFSTSEDPGKGRQMPISYTKKEIGVQTICTPLTTQLPHAAGAGYAFKLAEQDRVSCVFFGEGAASEGDFHAAMNFAAVLNSQTLFVCRNNGYAISTPVKDQYAGDGIAIRGLSYGMHTIRVDGNDFFASYIATAKARELCTELRVPVCLEFMTYRPSNEMNMWTQPGVDGISMHATFNIMPPCCLSDRLRNYLESRGLWDDAKEEELRREAKQFMLKELKVVATKKAVPILPGIFEDVYDTMPWHIQEQQEQLRKHLQKNSDKYDLKKYMGIE